jgi:hypothetical protein
MDFITTPKSSLLKVGIRGTVTSKTFFIILLNSKFITDELSNTTISEDKYRGK